jgi:hypothetical protein
MSPKREMLGKALEAIFNSTTTILDLIHKVSAGRAEHKHKAGK